MTSAKYMASVTKRALVQRINRALARQEQQLRACRGERAQQELGDYFILNAKQNRIVSRNIDLEELARELNLLAPFEKLV